MNGCTDLKDSCCLERIEIFEDGDNWIIKRRPEFKAMPDFKSPDPAYPDVIITPGQNPQNPAHIVPVEIIYPKRYADLQTLLEEAIPGIRAKEDQCGICKEALELIKRLQKKRR